MKAQLGVTFAPTTLGPLALLLLLPAVPLRAQVNLLTYRNDNGRTGLNPNETGLTLASVNTNTFGKLFAQAVDGYVYAQPLYLANVNVPGKGVHNVVFVATEHDSVYAFDADGNTGANAAPLWHTSFLDPAAGVTTVSAADTGEPVDLVPEVGITSTPVIDPVNGTIFVCAKTREISGGTTNYVHRLHALDVATGTEKAGGPAVIEAVVAGTGGGNDGAGHVPFVPLRQLNRPGLLWLNGVVYLGFGSHGDFGIYHGWVLGYDAQTLQQVVAYNTTPNGDEGAIWQAGAGLAADVLGNVYFMTGNGTFSTNSADNGQNNFGDSFVKLTTTNGWDVADYYTPSNQSELSAYDLDLGCGGPVLLPDEVGSAAHPHLLVGAGKEGSIYLLDRDNLGRYHTSGPDGAVQVLSDVLGGPNHPLYTGGFYGVPAYFDHRLYFAAIDDVIKVYHITGAQMGASPERVGSQVYLYPGGSSPCVSANGTNDAILWVLQNEAYGSSGPAILHAYNATNINLELYNSSQAGLRDQAGPAVKFTVPAVVNSKVYVGGQQTLTVYGLFAPDTNAPSAPGGLTATALSASRAWLNWTAATDDVAVTGYDVERAGGADTNFVPVGTTTGDTSYVDAGLTAQTSYNYRVRAFDAASNQGPYSAWAPIVTPAPDGQPPSTPVSLTATNPGGGYVLLDWPDCTDNVWVQEYRVERQGGGGTNFTEIGSTTNSSYDDVGLAGGMTYTYRVRAEDGSGNLGGYSPEAMITTASSPSGLVAAYGFDEGTGPTTADASGHGNTGTLAGAVWTSQGRFGGAVSFDGSGWISVDDADSLDLSNAMTLEAWLYPTAVPTGWSTALMKEQPGEFDYVLYAGSPLNQPNVFVYSGGEQGAADVSGLPLNVWTHLAGTYDGNSLCLYVNGTLVASNAVSGSIAQSSGPLRIGGNAVWGEYFQGQIDEVRIYSRALSAAEIQSDLNTPVSASVLQPPQVTLDGPTNDAAFVADAASIPVTATASDVDGAITRVDFLGDASPVASLTNGPFAFTWTGVTPGAHMLLAVATDDHGLTTTSAPVTIQVTANTGAPYGLTNRPPLPAYLNMPPSFNGALPLLLSGTGAFPDPSNLVAAAGLIPYGVNTPLWSDGAIKARWLGVPGDGAPITADEQIGYAPTGEWTFPNGTVFVKHFELVTDETHPTVRRRLETRLLVRDGNGAVYGVTYKWRADNSDADLLTNSLLEDIVITNAAGVRTQTWYYPSPGDCLVCHTPTAGYVLGVKARQLNGDLTYPGSGVADNQLRTLNQLGLFNPPIRDETSIASVPQLSALTNLSASLEQRARSYLDANCAQCHRPGGTRAHFDARYDTPLASQNIINGSVIASLGVDNMAVVTPQDPWRSALFQRMNTANPVIRMPPLARNVIDTDAVSVMAAWINGLPGVPALAPPAISPNGGTFNGAVSVSVSATDTVASLFFTLDGTLPTTNAPAYVAPVLLTNSATFKAVAAQTGYNNSVAAVATFTINQLPAITLTNPVAGGVFVAPTNILLEAAASDADGSVGLVTFLDGTNVLGQVNTPPFSVLWSNAPAGIHVLAAEATDNQGATAVSEAATIAVLPPTLSAQFAGGQLQIAWPDTGNDYVLESTDSLTPPVNWTPAPEAHTPTNGQIVVLLAPTNHQEFYRLRP